MEVATLLMIYQVECVFRIKQDVDLNAFNMITRAKVSRKLTKHISYDCKCDFHGKKRDLNQK